MPKKLMLLMAIVFVVILFGYCAFILAFPKREKTFASFPGFDAYYKANPRRTSSANDSEKELLKKYKPSLFISEGGTAPISFYDDYIANGELRDLRGKILKKKRN